MSGTDYDEREGKLPGWARGIISGLRSDLSHERSRTAELEQEAETLRRVASGAHGDETADTIVILDNEDATRIPVQGACDVRFADFYAVRYDADPAGGGARVLIIETDQPMQVRPYDRDAIVIAAAG